MKIDNNTLLSSVASGLLINAVYPTTSEMITILGDVMKGYKVANCLTIDLLVCILKIISIVLIFLLFWWLITLFLPYILNIYDKKKTIKYSPMSGTKKRTLFYGVFNEIMRSELNVKKYKLSEFYYTMNKMMVLSDRLILSVTKNKSDLSLMNSILRTKSRNQHRLNSNSYINIYDLRGALDILIKNMNVLEIAYNQLNITDSFLLSDLCNSKGQLEKIKESIKENE